MTNVLSVYYSPWHWRAEDAQYIHQLDPAWVRIHQPTAKAIQVVQQAAPNAKLMLRSWDIDDSNGERKREMYADPRSAAHKHLAMWRIKWEELEAELRRNGWTYNTGNWYLGLVNEPHPDYINQVVDYSQEAMRQVQNTQIRLGVVVPSVGNFSKPSENDHGWTKCIPLEKPINDGGHLLIVHEYWQPEGPRYGEDAGNLAWRHHIIPLNVPILVGEAGANGYIYGRHSQQDDAGWRKFMQPDQYATQVQEYIAGCDTRVKGVCLFMTDFHSDQWWSFDTQPAMQQLLSIKDVRPRVPSPFDNKPQPPDPKPPITSKLVHPLPGSVITQHWGQNADNYAQFGLWGHNGTDMGGRPLRTPVRSMAQGIVAYSDFDAAYGHYVRVDHRDLGCYSFYAHMDEAGAPTGRVLHAGDTVGLLGSSGNSTGPHLHIEIRLQNKDGTYREDTPMLRGRCDPETWCCLHGLKL